MAKSKDNGLLVLPIVFFSSTDEYLLSYDHFKFSGHFDPESRTWRGRSYVIHTKIYIRWYSQYLRRITYVVMMYIHHILFFPVFAKLTTDKVYNPRFYVGFHPNHHWLDKFMTEKVYNPRCWPRVRARSKRSSSSDEILGQVDYTLLITMLRTNGGGVICP